MKDLTTSQIQELINQDRSSSKKNAARIGQKYYDGEHDILQYRVFYYNADGELVEDRYRSNERISHPFFTELVDQLTSYILSDEEENIITSDEEGCQEYLDSYFNDEFYAELADCITGATIKGFDYLYGYKNEENKMKFQYADALGVIEVREKDTDSGCDAIIYTYIDRIDYGRKVIKRIQVHYSDKTAYYVQIDGEKIMLDENITPNPRPNVIYRDEKGTLYGKELGYIPFWRFDYNRKQLGSLSTIKGLIDDYDLMECGLSNNLQDFDNPLYVIKGFRGNNLDELQHNIKTKKVIGVGDNGDVDIKTIQVPYEARKAKAEADEKNIYRFGMGLNTQGLKDTAATTNLAIQAAYTLLDLKATKVIKNLKKFLKQIVRVVIDEINNNNGTGYSADNVKITFHPNILLNKTENISNDKIKAETKQIEINTILNVAAQIGDEETLKKICDVMDIDFEDIKDILEEDKDDITNAQVTLNNVQTEEPTEPTEEGALNAD